MKIVTLEGGGARWGAPSPSGPPYPHLSVGDVVMFRKSEKEFDKQHQYGLVVTTWEGRDGLTWTEKVEYQNARDTVKRRTRQSVQDLVMIHPVDELDISNMISHLLNNSRFFFLFRFFFHNGLSNERGRV